MKAVAASLGVGIILLGAGGAVAPSAATCWLPTHLIKIGNDQEWVAYIYVVGDLGFEIFDLSVYLETNGAPHVQMRGESLFGKDAGCEQSATPDLLAV